MKMWHFQFKNHSKRLIYSLLLVAGLSLGTGVVYAAKGGVAGPDNENFNPANGNYGNHCISFSGNDVNALLNLSAHFVAGICGPVSSGEFWTTAATWGTNFPGSTFPIMYPAGYTPALANPIDDFVSKIGSVKYMVDAGTSQEKTYVFKAKSANLIIKKFNLGDFYVLGQWLLPDNTPIPMNHPGVLAYGILAPQQIGTHTVLYLVNLTAKHCDGFTTDESYSCIGPGDVALILRHFEVLPGAAQSQ